MSDVLAEGGVEGVRTLYVGAPFKPFERAMPEAVEASLFQSFEGLLNETQVRECYRSSNSWRSCMAPRVCG